LFSRRLRDTYFDRVLLSVKPEMDGEGGQKKEGETREDASRGGLTI